MTANSSSVQHLSVVMTTTSVVDGRSVASPSSDGLEYYFQCAVVVVGVVGTATNALILYALVASKQHKKLVLIVNQNALDLCSCLFLAITYAVKLCNIQLTGWLGYWLCMLILNYNLLWCLTIGAVINLPIITVERYVKIVHPAWSKNGLKKSMIYSAAAFSWISGFIYSNSVTISTSALVGGVCYAQMFYTSRIAKMVHGIYNFVSFYVVVLLIFILCYWRILVVIRRQANIMARHSAVAGSSIAQARSIRIQSNIIKTMILVSAFYAISWAPVAVYYLLVNLDAPVTITESGFYSAQFVSRLYICANPFIYATKFDPVKCILVSLIPCKKTSEQPVESIEITGHRTVATRAI